MTVLTGTAGAGAFLGIETGPLVIEPVSRMSVAIVTSTRVVTSAHTYRVPKVLADPNAAWIAEGAEIAPSDMAFGEETVSPSKLAGLTVLSHEMLADANPSAVQTIGDGLARDLAKKLDSAFYGALAAPAPSGLGALTGIQEVTTAGYANLDAFAQALSLAETVGAQITAFVASPADVLALSTVKVGDAFNSPLLGLDATAAGMRRVLGVPLISSPAVEPGVVWCYDSSRMWVIIREDVRLDVDKSVFFTSDRVAVRATLRVGFAYPHASSVVVIRST